MSDPTPTGLLVLQGNRLELLAEAVFAWLRAHPLAPLEPETFLVHSNGMAEWLKMELARAHGVCAATRVELPARFLWRAYRAVLGRSAVPAVAALDKLPLTWRLMRQLPTLAAQPGFEPVAGFLAGNDPARRLQLAQRLADLFDQYQVYRSDWLDDWAQGADQLRSAGGAALPVPADQRWQPALWRALLQALPPADRQAGRGGLHRRFVQALGQGPMAAEGSALPRRIVLFGTAHLPLQTLEALAALARHAQVLMAVPNPCRYHWADTIEGRELLRAERRRHGLRGGRELAPLPLSQMHAHGHPLLAAWGRQSRDFLRQLDAFDDTQATRQRFQVPRVDLFDETPPRSLLQQLQAQVRDLVPLAEHPWPQGRANAVAPDDRSIVFHVAHSAQREVEVLHDQLLRLLAEPPSPGRGERPLQPRDIVVMVPDIEGFAPAIRSVFGQHARGHARHIPWGITDQPERGHQPLLVALEWLLHAPQQRFTASELRDLLDVPAVARRFGLAADDLPALVTWIGGAGIRWGLDGEHRARLGLAAAGDQNSWAFGLRRMLLGFATGELPQADGFAGIEPYAEVAGLEAGLAGTLAELLERLGRWWREATQARTPGAWAEQLRGLLAGLFEASDDTERGLLSALDEALAHWLAACEAAGFDDQPLDLAVAREAWLQGLDEPGAARRFRAGGVTFCTLLPLRAIPFEVVCLLGMNEGDYPRRGTRNDFDLMALPGQARPGDRSRRHDDRQLMLDALLSARRVLYLSWAGRSQRDNQAQPPSVLVAQLRDHLAAGWGPAVLQARTTEHPLQPFSRRYFEPAAGGGASPRLFTYAGEWRAAHAVAASAADRSDLALPAADRSGLGLPTADRSGLVLPTADRSGLLWPSGVPEPRTVGVGDLAAFLRNPVRAFFRHRLQVVFDEHDVAVEDDEPFGLDSLARWQLADRLLQALRREAQALPEAAGAGSTDAIGFDAAAALQAQAARLQRAGQLPLSGVGARSQARLVQMLQPMLQRWQAARADHPRGLDPQALRWGPVPDAAAPWALDDWLAGLRGTEGGTTPPVWIELQASRLAEPGTKGRVHLRGDKLLTAWVRGLASAACGQPVAGLLIGPGAALQLQPPDPAAARATLGRLLQACAEGLTGDRPLATAVATGLVWLDDPARARQRYEGSRAAAGEGAEPCLARLFPDFATLAAAPDFEASTRRLYADYRDWLASQVQVEWLPEAEADESPATAAEEGDG